ncbi:hypothetical protein HNR23_004395 [Nocardiopsis mwathae]|uniref:Uncharacterized protein n=2 Tax=Nocardiopsis mwathae TaxID=1472723 RepID=A0A7X0D7G6_9ACTN|nr:hypothetical protein [Nocardiopsis mwathae]
MIGGEGGGDGLVGTTASVTQDLQYASSCSNSGPVSYALGGFLEAFAPKMHGMAAKSGGAVIGCGEATRAYLDGDTEMAAEAQSSARHVGDLGL